MSALFVDQLLEAIARRGSPICIGIDPIYELLPDAVAGPKARRDANDLDASLDAIHAFCTAVLQTIAPIAPIVKFQSAYFERYLWEGVEAYYELIQEAKDLGLLTIGDVKRGDIGSTSAAYADAHLAPLPFAALDHVTTPDAITINPMLGLDSIEPFIRAAREHGKGLFVLVRTSNPGSATLQDALLSDGRTWSQMLADELAPLAESEGLLGAGGWSNVGAVVGATQVQTIESLRTRLPKSFFLLPGYGTQGATAQMTRAAFDAGGRGAIVSASRSILYESDSTPPDWIARLVQRARRMQDDVKSILG